MKDQMLQMNELRATLVDPEAVDIQRFSQYSAKAVVQNKPTHTATDRHRSVGGNFFQIWRLLYVMTYSCFMSGMKQAVVMYRD